MRTHLIQMTRIVIEGHLRLDTQLELDVQDRKKHSVALGGSGLGAGRSEIGVAILHVLKALPGVALRFRTF